MDLLVIRARDTLALPFCLKNIINKQSLKHINFYLKINPTKIVGIIYFFLTNNNGVWYDIAD